MKKIILWGILPLVSVALVFGGLFWYSNQTRTQAAKSSPSVTPQNTAETADPTCELLQGMWISDDAYLETLVFREDGRFEFHYAVYEEAERAEEPIFKTYQTLEGTYSVISATTDSKGRYPFLLHMNPAEQPQDSTRAEQLMQEEEWVILDLIDKYQLETSAQSGEEEPLRFVKKISGQ